MESLAPNIQEMTRTPLSEMHVEALRSAGEVVDFPADEVIFEVGDAMDKFTYILEGGMEIIDPVTRKAYLPTSLGPTQFVGEIAFLNGGAYSLPMRTTMATKAIQVPREKMLELMSGLPEMSDIIITVFAARRRRQIEAGDTSLTLIGVDSDRNIRRIAEFASRNKIPFKIQEPGSADAEAKARVCGVPADEPAVIFGSNRLVEDPTPEKVAELLGLVLDVKEDEVVDTLIVGGGPAGVAAAVYAGAEGLSAIVVEDVAVGGQAGTSSRIENYLGFPTGISGADLVWRGEIQAMKFGTRFMMPRRVENLERRPDGIFVAHLNNGQQLCAKSVVVATGVQYRRLPIERLEHFEGSGIYYAATEMEARYCKASEAVIVGGGNSAGQAAMFLSRTARHVHVLIRGESLAASMSSYLSERLESTPNITVHYKAQITDLHGEADLGGLTINRNGEEWNLDTPAVFVMVGAAPNTGWLESHCALDPRGFVLTGEDAASPFETTCKGIFAVGDVRANSVKRVASSVGEGSVVISKVWEHVNS
ncbi:FAD-dependent oxidoreductase [Roseobacter sp. OBYS 0001]|uniref:FAD-dependent oxidoreductase n=1 Tax=Roseobacter sp. OBYS 0001 TaxID=882651 RepID=UPI001BC06D16|nr:FAD-dependent oxidoreductase [Roseobacter sp. OBYS 0001]GIT86458.1 thioredoxin reductase [Roseobacter sp. OBYS 0001]